MAYEVLARKWRPQQFGELVGQSHIAQTLTNAVASDHVAHAYLFVGPRGTGKTSTARILAKALDCEQGPTATPCDACEGCRQIMAGSHLDVLEIDGASNTGVDHVRDLRENTKFAPSVGQYKIYIIDEVHMLSTGAFNALLKTLEEPPRHVKFIFATTEPQKVPATILSRCQRFDFRRISTRDIVERLGEIASAEAVEIEDAALLAIARGAEGGMRDALSALDQLIAFRGATIKEPDVLAVFGLVAQQTLDDLAGAVLSGDVPKLIDIVAELDAAGKDMQQLVTELLAYFRNLLIYVYAGDATPALELTDAQAEVLKKLAAGHDAGRILAVVDQLVHADGRMRHALTKRTLLETALIRAARAASSVSVDAVLAQLQKLKSSLAPGAEPAEKKTAKPSMKPGAAPRPASLQPAVAGEEQCEPKVAGEEVAALSERWHEVVDQVGLVAPLARNYLLDAKPDTVDADVVRIGFDPEFAESRTKIDYPRNVLAIEKTLRSVLGRKVRVEFCVLESKDTLPGDTKFEQSANGDERKPKAAQPERRRAAARSRGQWVENPVVRKTLEMFNGDIVDIRE